MNDLISTTALTPPEPDVAKSKAMLEFEAAMSAVAFSPADAARADQLSKSGRTPAYEIITPGVAAAIFKLHNSKANRAFSVSKCDGYVAAMKRGEWKKHHLGAAFYSDGTLADAQHRMGACALSGVTIEMLVTNDFNRDSIDTIDRATRRTAGETLEMDGITDGKLKAAIAKNAIQYVAEVDQHNRPTLTDPQIEAFVHQNDLSLSAAITIGRSSAENVNDPCISSSNAAQFAFLALFGGWQDSQVRAFIACVQQGIANYSESPTLELSRRLQRAKLSEKKRDRLRPREMMGLILHAMTLWSTEARVSRLSINVKNLPNYRAPVVDAPAPVAQAAE